MKKISFVICMAIAAVSFSFTLPTPGTTVEDAINSPVQFKVINDTGADFVYHVNSAMHTITPNQSVGFSYDAGTIVYRDNNGQQGTEWFTVAAEMQGKSIQLSSLLNN